MISDTQKLLNSCVDLCKFFLTIGGRWEGWCGPPAIGTFSSFSLADNAVPRVGLNGPLVEHALQNLQMEME